ncbi:unnamed protein product [Closterium sp. NIES-54]
MARQRANKAGAHQWREEQALAGRAGPALGGRLHGVQGRRCGSRGGVAGSRGGCTESRGGCTKGGCFRGQGRLLWVQGRLLEGPRAAAPGAAASGARGGCSGSCRALSARLLLLLGAFGSDQLQLQRRPRETLTSQQLHEWYA